MLDVSVVIPTLNAQATLGRTIAPLRGHVREIVVSDGGSQDDTISVAQQCGAVVLVGPAGRGGQLLRGARASSSGWFLFLHADTQLQDPWRDRVAEAIADDPAIASYFQFALDDDTPQARRLERMVAWRSRVLALPYGDQGLLISRQLYDATGGWRDMPLMEDVDFVRRIGRIRLAALQARAVTSAEKFRRDGYTWRSAKNLFFLGLYTFGVNPAAIKRIYG
jgi:rSAM/selenodomain-associated transferase 2